MESKTHQVNSSVSASADSARGATEEKSPSTPEQSSNPDMSRWLILYNTFLLSAEHECPGVTARVTAADFSAIVCAVVKTIGAGAVPARYRLNPPPSLLQQTADAVQKTASALAAVGAGGVNLSGVAEKKRGPSGKKTTRRSAARTGPSSGAKSRTAKAPVKRTAAPSKGKAANPVGPADKPSGPAAKAADHPSVGGKSVRDKILSKALRSFRGTGPQAKLARDVGLTEASLKASILALSDKEIADRRQSGVPALAFTGAFDNLVEVSWNAEYEGDAWLTQARRRASRARVVARADDAVPHVYVQPQSGSLDSREVGKNLFSDIRAAVTGAACWGEISPSFAAVVKGAKRSFYTARVPASAVDPMSVRLTLDSGDTDGSSPRRTVAELWASPISSAGLGLEGCTGRHVLSVSSRRQSVVPAGVRPLPWQLALRPGDRVSSPVSKETKTRGGVN